MVITHLEMQNNTQIIQGLIGHGLWIDIDIHSSCTTLMHDLSSRHPVKLAETLVVISLSSLSPAQFYFPLITQIFVPRTSPRYFLPAYIYLESFSERSLLIADDCRPSVWAPEQTQMEWSWIQPATRVELLHEAHAGSDDIQSIYILWAWEQILMIVSYQVWGGLLLSIIVARGD